MEELSKVTTYEEIMSEVARLWSDQIAEILDKQLADLCIATATRRGTANWMIIHPDICAKLFPHKYKAENVIRRLKSLH